MNANGKSDSAGRRRCWWRGTAWLAVLGAFFASSLSHAAVTIDQSPLTARGVLAANIVMMLDDSRSMEWTVMPDDPSGPDRRNVELINPAVNGVYYDPKIVYLAPYVETAQPEAVVPTFTRYPAATFTAARIDGFDTGSAARNIATYKGADDQGPDNIANVNPAFSHTFRTDFDAVYQYVAAGNCPSGYQDPDGDGICAVPSPKNEQPYCQGAGGYDAANDRCNRLAIVPDACGSTPALGAPQGGTVNSAGMTLHSSDTCRKGGSPNEPPRCSGYGGYDAANNRCATQNPRPQACSSTRAPGTSGTLNSSGLVLSNDRCRSETTLRSCPTGYTLVSDSGPNKEDCRRQVSSERSEFRSLFVYTERAGSGTPSDPYVDTLNYVGVATSSTGDGTEASPLAGTCANITSREVTVVETGEHFATGVDPSRCHAVGSDSTLRDSANAIITVGQNVANWFSYYRTRLLMSKSGLMNAFAALDPGVRLGFGSINGGTTTDNAGRLPTDRAGTSPKIARVKPYGSGILGTQRSAFWSWLATAKIDSGGTPLLQALNSVGTYYQSDDQPWQSGDAENSANPKEELSCRQSYTILMTDGFWNGANPGIGEWDKPAANQRVDGPNSRCFEYPKASAGTSCEAPPAEKPYADSDTNTLADIAMKYWLSDLRTTANNVPSTSDDPAFWQHMSTFTVGLFGQDAALPGITPSTAAADDIIAWARNGDAPTDFDWPTPADNSSNNLSDLVHAGINGRGGFYSAGNPDAFERGIRDALRRVQDRAGTGASLAANSTRLDIGTTTYQSVYNTGKWTGELKALAVNPNSGAISTAATWSAADEMPSWSTRNIKTYNPSGGNADAKFPLFSDPSTLSASQRTALGIDTATQQEMIDYLRGNAVSERRNGGTFRDRSTPLGDIVNSQPVYVGAPSANVYANRSFTGSNKYSKFAGDNASRAARVWVAANDGLLHSFNAATGVETFAFMPNAVILSGVKSIANATYGGVAFPHKFYNDGEITVADAYVGSEWKTVLVGTTGRGPAKAVYAFDVTDPSSPSLLWERSADDGVAGSNYIGQMVGKPVIAQTSNGSWSVLLGNGYNSTVGKAALLQFDLATGSLSVHPTSNDTDNGLAPPAVWISDTTNAVGTQAYAGDLKGKVWAFELSSATSTGTALFTADNGGVAQPITGGMLVGKDPATDNVWLFFGTGTYLDAVNLKDKSVNTWYGIIAKTGLGQPANLVTNLASGRAALVQRTILSETAAASDPPKLGARELDAGSKGDTAGKSGWYMDLIVKGGSAKGERITTPNQFQGNLLLATTRIPSAGTDSCNPSGDGWIMAVNPFLGTGPKKVFFDINSDGNLDANDMINSAPAGGLGFTSIPNNPIFVGNVMLISFDNATTSSIQTAGSVGDLIRESWREFVNQ